MGGSEQRAPPFRRFHPQESGYWNPSPPRRNPHSGLDRHLYLMRAAPLERHRCSRGSAPRSRVQWVPWGWVACPLDGLSPGDSLGCLPRPMSPPNSYHPSGSEMVLSDRKGLTQQNKNKQAACASRSWAGCQQRRLSMTRLWRSGNGRELMRVPVL